MEKDPSGRQRVAASVERIRAQMDHFETIFFGELFKRLPASSALFPSAEARRSKLGSMLALLGRTRHLERMLPAIDRLGARHGGYGVVPSDYAPFVEALVSAISAVDEQAADPGLMQAWQHVLEEMVGLMSVAPGQEGRAVRVSRPGAGVESSALYGLVGGHDGIDRVHRRFYRSLLDDPWLGFFFSGKNLDSLVLKQTHFMAAAFGGPAHYQWESPAIAHMHMLVLDEQADIREILLRNAIRADGLDQSIEDRWLAVDQSFRPAVVKRNAGECVMRCVGQMPVTAEKPFGYRPPRLLPRTPLPEA